MITELEELLRTQTEEHDSDHEIDYVESEPDTPEPTEPKSTPEPEHTEPEPTLAKLMAEKL
jgi:hypothetical protein